MTEYEKGSRAWEKFIKALLRIDTPQNQKWVRLWGSIADKRFYDYTQKKTYKKLS